MRLLALAAAASLVALPAHAFAQETEPESELATVIEKMEDPVVQAGVAGMLAALSEAMLDMPIGPLVEAIERADGEPTGLEEDATIRDLAGPEAEDLPAEMAERVPEMMDAASGMARGFEAMMPMLRAWAEEMEASIAHARDHAG